MRRAILVFVLAISLFSVSVESLQPDNNKKKENQHTIHKEINYEQECETRFGISKKKKKIMELEKRVNRCKNQETELKNLKRSTEKLKQELKEKTAENEAVMKGINTEKSTATDLEDSMKALQTELEFQKTHVTQALIEKLYEIFEIITTEVSIFASFSSFYFKSIQGTTAGTALDALVSSFWKLLDGVSFVLDNTFNRLARLLLTPLGLQEEASTTGFVKNKTVDTFETVGSTVYDFYQELRNSSITRLQENPRISYLAEEVVDLGLLALIFCVFLVVINPVVSFFVRTFYNGVRSLICFAIALPKNLAVGLGAHRLSKQNKEKTA